MNERQKKYVEYMRQVQRSMDAHFSAIFKRLAEDRMKEAAIIADLHASDCGYRDPDDGECDCGLEIGLRF